MYASESCDESSSDENDDGDEDQDYLRNMKPPAPDTFSKWSKKELILKKKYFPGPPNKKDFSEDITPTSIFNLFFDDDVIRVIVEMTNLYARRDHGDHTFTTTPNERRRFIAILLLSGYNWLPRRRMYWETAPDVHNQCVADAIPRNRIDTLMKYLHLCDNEKPVSGDKMWKIRPCYD